MTEGAARRRLLRNEGPQLDGPLDQAIRYPVTLIGGYERR
jgi:hypothetical protein